jgi:hypothetical protein
LAAVFGFGERTAMRCAGDARELLDTNTNKSPGRTISR